MASISRSMLARRAFLSISNRQAIPLHHHHASAKGLTSILTSQHLQSSPSLLDQIPTKSTAVGSIRIASFHASSRNSIIPPPPQKIIGTVNDPTPIPPPSPTHGSYHWTFERLLAGALVPLTIAPFATGSLNPVTDAILAAAILIHSHVGFQSIIIDYIPQRRLRKTRMAFWWGLRAATLMVAMGLYEFETNDVGLTEAVKRIWKA